MSNYLNGCDILGSDWGGSAIVLDDPSYGAPFTVDEDFGVPVEVMGELQEVLGLFDLNTTTQQMNSLKQVPVSVAQALLKGGQAAIDQARAVGTANSLPGGTARDKVYWGLQWHQNALLPLATTPNAMYASANDLKKFVTSAYVEANAAEVGADYLNGAWSAMWRDIAVALAALPPEIRKAVADTVSNVTGLPLWGWAIVVLGTLGAVSFLAVKLADTKLGAAVGGRIPL